MPVKFLTGKQQSELTLSENVISIIFILQNTLFFCMRVSLHITPKNGWDRRVKQINKLLKINGFLNDEVTLPSQV